jgi:ABC-2 type transport system permease protein
LSLRRHYDAFLLGLFDSADLAYYLLFGMAFLGLAIRRLDDLRLRD